MRPSLTTEKLIIVAFANNSGVMFGLFSLVHKKILKFSLYSISLSFIFITNRPDFLMSYFVIIGSNEGSIFSVTSSNITVAPTFTANSICYK